MTLSLMSARQIDGDKNIQLTKRRARTGAALFGVIFLAQFLFGTPIAKAITVGPAKLEYRADPGEVIQGSIFVINDSSEEQTFYPSFEKFIEVNGEKKFLPGEPTELANWFKMSPSVTLAPKEQKDIPITIEIPSNAPPGGHFAVIWWGNAPPDTKQVSIVTRAGILVYLQVSGEVKESGSLLFFKSLAGRIAARLPDFEVRFKNTGNTYLKPQGKVEVKNILNGTVAVFKVNDIQRILLPDGEESLRLTPQFEKRPFAFGLYHADLNLAWGDKPETLEARYYFLILPWLHILVGAIVLILAYFGVKIGLRKYNRYVIAKYASGGELEKDSKNKKT